MLHHQNAFIVQHGYSCWIQKLPAAENNIVLEEILASTPNTRKSPAQTIRGTLSQRVRTYNGLTMRILFSSLQWYRRKSCSTSTRRKSNNIDVSKWLSRRVVGLCNGVVLPLAERARQDNRWQDTMRGVTCDFDPVRSNIQPQTDILKSRASAAAVRPTDASWNLHGVMSYVREEDGQVSLLIANCEDLKKRSDFESCVKKFKHQDTKKSPKKETLPCSCADGFLKHSVLPRPHSERRAGKNLEQDEKSRIGPSFQEENGTYLGTWTSGNFIHRHHEVN